MALDSYLKKRILIVDDLPNTRADLLGILQRLGFEEIDEAADGKIAWEKLRFEALLGAPYEIMFLDINMPNVNGIALLKKIRATDLYSKIPVFMVSTENERSIIVKAVLEGATDYILKPYAELLVVEKICKHLK